MRHLLRILREKETSQLSIQELVEFSMKFSTMFTFTYRPNFYRKLGINRVKDSVLRFGVTFNFRWFPDNFSKA